MTSNSRTKDERKQEAVASLSLRGKDLGAVAESLQIPPDKWFRRGELPPLGRIPREWDLWVIEERSGDIPAETEYVVAVHLCLDRLLDRITAGDLAAKLTRLHLEERPVISVHGHCFEIPCLYYQAKTIRAIADLGADLWEDFYLISPADEGESQAD